MKFPDYEKHDALALAALVKGGEISAPELLEAAIERAELHNPRINALCSQRYDAARSIAASHLPDGPFTGVPFLLKDTVPAVGLPMSFGSRFFEGSTHPFDNETVARHRRAGLVIFGRTTSPEMAMGPSTEVPVYGGPTRNPWNLAHSSGGSSGGAAAAVAAGILPMAHATDGAGSIRIPASCCGLFGLKPTRARLPAGPMQGEGWAGMSTEHVVSRSVRDSAAMLDATCGADVGAPYTVPLPSKPFLQEVGAPPGRLRVAMLKTSLTGDALDPEVAAAMDGAATLCEKLGHGVSEARMTELSAEEMLDALIVIVASGVASVIERRAKTLGREPREDELEPATWDALRYSRQTTGAQYVAAVGTVHRIGRIAARFMDHYDVVLMPVLTRPPVPLGELTMKNADFVDYRKRVARYSAFSPVANLSGQPACSVPLAWSSEGLPIGVQFVARYGDEATLFRLAAQLEAAQPWFSKRPPGF
jgi:amidase